MGDDDVPCACCSTLRALLHCAQHGARLCLPCDVRVHVAAPAHRRAPLCDACHAAPAAARCADHQALLCAPCARAAGCDADRHARRAARAYTGIPDPAELARILYCDGDCDTAAPPPPEWVPDLVNVELLPDYLPASSRSWRDGNITSRPDTSETAHTFVRYCQPQASPSSLGYDHPLIASCSEPIIASTDAVLESMASNNAAYHHQPQQQFSSVPTANNSTNVAAGSTFYGSGMPAMLPRDESFPSSQFGFEVKPPPVPAVVSSPTTEAAALLAPEQPPSGQDMEARTKQLEKRQEAKQRYKDKKKNRKFGKQIMYVSRKVRADTRNRVKGRFAKACSGSGHGDDQSTQHGDDDEQPADSCLFLPQQ
ncbi:zinc finger protein CONSTANS-LIKE 13-like [Panicum virgatum]|uniref:zinc finger protein CONSTANS-LIKE 13-like n=1 Tax=Panicum virgatum TaxID=38727 RepID=UPI0019D59A4C|nr:zinc finger protein CONSTANS-LIKE 13-like [Panicum virgatum]